MTNNPAGEPPVWPSGIGGAQCDRCGETTIVRHFGSWDDENDENICRACIEGWYEADDDDDSWGLS